MNRATVNGDTTMPPQSNQEQKSNSDPSQKQKQDPFLTNDYYPLQLGNKAIIAALRADEVSSNADLYKVISSSTASTSTYKVVGEDGTMISAAGTSAGATTAANGTAAPAMNGHMNGGTHTANTSDGMTNINPGTSTASYPNHSRLDKTPHPILKYTNSIPIPHSMRQKIEEETKLSSLMGILPQGNMIWISVDDRLFLWEYGNSLEGETFSGNSFSGGGAGRTGGPSNGDFVCFRVPSGQCVVSVGLVKPKKGVFKDVVEWCLVVTTHEEVIICALTRQPMVQQQQQIPFGMSSPNVALAQSDTYLNLIPTRYLIPTDSIPMLSICGTDDGRIFMGGYDGCLYEMSYEGYVPSSPGSNSKQRGGWYEDNNDDYDYENNTSMMETFASGSKRAFSTLLFGPSTMPQGESARPRKCRKVNHTSLAPKIVSAFIPGFVMNAASYVLGSNSTSAGGPIVKLTLDNDRKTMYALTSKGFIHAFDLEEDVKSSPRSVSYNTNPPKLACTINVSKSVRKYLDCVAHGKLYAPSMGGGADGSIADIQFAGGGAAAQAGVGGMEGARSILKIADSEMMKRKQRQQAASNANSNGRRQKVNATRTLALSEGCLHPVSIDVVPPTESKHLTLIVVSTAGLRYHLSVLPEGGMNRFRNNSTKPGRRFTLCHIRAPPPLSITSNDEISFDGGNVNFANTSVNSISGITPSLQSRNGVLTFETKNACYKNGTTLVAMDCSKSASADSQGSIGDSIVVMNPDYTSQDRGDPVNASYIETTTSMDGKGLSEIVSQPTKSSDSTSSIDSTVLAGGHLWDIKVNTNNLLDYESRSIMNLYNNSTTPSDSILDSEIIPPFVPSSRLRRRTDLNAVKGSSLQFTSFDAAKSVQEQRAVKSKDVVDNRGIAYTALSTIASALLAKLFSKSIPTGKAGKIPMYQIVHSKACNSGFSDSALDKSKYGRRMSSNVASSVQSMRLHTSLLKPSITPLPGLSTEHLINKSKRQGLIALNSGGLHYFSQQHPIDVLRKLLSETNFSNIGKNERVMNFFENYNRVESIALCLSIAIDEHSSDQLSRTAIQAVMRNSTQPRMKPTQNNTAGPNTILTEYPSENELNQVEGFTFQPSALHDGLLAITSRLLRPIWCKPAVVVTEGRITKPQGRNQRQRMRPAKVELLLDEITIDRIRKPLARLLILMKEFFHRAVDVVPGSKTKVDNTMETDEIERKFVDDSTLLTSAIQFQTRRTPAKPVNSKTKPSDQELKRIAQLNEERNIHAIYRIVSRSVQFLTLMTQLQRAHENHDLPEVEFGYLHGLTYSQLVTSKIAQDRIDTVLTNMFTSDSSLQNINSNPSSVESNRLSSLLSSQCYLYFSIASRLTYLGFSTALSAMSQQSSRQRDELTKAASSYLRQAAKHWYNPVLISGQYSCSDIPQSFDAYEAMAQKAHDGGSPLSRAAFALMELSDVVGVVAVCLICASNFGGLKYDADSSQLNMENSSGGMMTWEKGLYHRPMSPASVLDMNDDTNAMQVGESEKGKIVAAKYTCYAILFNCLSCLLKSTYEYQQNVNLAEQMLAFATSSKDLHFLKELYGYLASSGHVETLLRIESPSVESWLENIKKDPDLLWRYYVIHSKHCLAGEFMWKRGAINEETLRLEERIECLTRAANSYSVSLSDLSGDSSFQNNSGIPNDDEIKRIINRIREQVDVAKLQLRVLSEVKSSDYVSQMDKGKMHTLSFSLVGVSDLYNDYAAPLSFYDICLAIMQTCRCDDSATIITLWRSIICEEILPCQTSDKDVQRFLSTLQRGSMMEEEQVILTDTNVTDVGGESLRKFEDGGWVTSLKNRIVSLGRELFGKGADFVFPVDFIVEQLEGLYTVQKAASGNSVGPWTLKTLIEAGASYPVLLEAYNSLVVAQEPNSTNPITRVSQLSCISGVLKHWLSTTSAFGDNGDNFNLLKRYATILLQQVDSYKSTLESLTGWDRDEISNIHSSFCEIEESLRRLDN